MPNKFKTEGSGSQEILPQGYDAQRAKLIGADPLVGIDPITGQPQRSVSKDNPAASIPADEDPVHTESSSADQGPDEQHAGMRR